VKILEAPPSALPTYGRIPIAFDVREILDCVLLDGGLGGLQLQRREVSVPYIKDYDAIAGEGPQRWNTRFDTSRWALLVAEEHGEWIGGATLVFDTPGVNLLEGRGDLLVLWDLRVHPEARGRGVGSALFGAAVEWGRSRGCTRLKVETQNVNVPACRFYARQGCTLGAIDRFAYPELPDEIRLLWYRDISPALRTGQRLAGMII
jgi:GNAT superfamily N-acetyltransferase